MQRFEFVIYFFGALLIYSGYKLFSEQEREIHPEKNPVLKLFRRRFPVTENYEGDRFFVRRNGQRFATPLFLVLLVVETTDVIFAIDSIPAILAITRDAFIVYTSNVFAILGLRALYFALSGLITLFHYLNYGLAVILMFVGAKMLASHYYDLPVTITLAVIAAVIIVAPTLAEARAGGGTSSGSRGSSTGQAPAPTQTAPTAKPIERSAQPQLCGDQPGSCGQCAAPAGHSHRRGSDDQPP